jgi:hypothetical protein
VPERDPGGQPTAEEQLRALYENAESTAARAFEQAVATPSFGALLARSAENVAALSRVGSDLADLVLRNLRLAGRADITRLARQLHRTEDKLERVLQEVELLRDELASAQAGTTAGRAQAGTTAGRASRPANARASTGNGRAGGGAAGAAPRGGTAGAAPRAGTRGGSTRSRSRTQ